MGASSQKVQFYSDGYKIAGVLQVPSEASGERRVPAVVVVHGFASIKEIHPPPVAAELNERGYATLALDFRGFGESEGRRGVLRPMEQVQDIMNGVTFLSQVPEVDPSKIGLMGFSFGGSEALVASALDSRVTSVVATVSVGDVEAWLRSMRSWWEWKKLLKRLESGRPNRVRTGQIEYISIPDFLNLDPEVRGDFEKRVTKYPTWSLNIALESLEPLIAFRPEEYVHRIAPRGVMVISVTDDDVVNPEESRRIFERAQEPKKFVTLKTKHYEVYVPPVLRDVIGEAVPWFQRFMQG